MYFPFFHPPSRTISASHLIGDEKCFLPLLFKGAYDSIRGSYNRSRDAERRANEATTTKPSTVSQSADTRRRAERIIAAKKDDFNRKNAANKRALGELNAKAQGLDMKKLNEKVLFVLCSSCFTALVLAVCIHHLVGLTTMG